MMRNRQSSSPLLNGIALFLLMLITGVFWGTWFTLTRSLTEFPAPEFIHIGKAIIANVAMPMRFLMPGGILLMAIAVWLARKNGAPRFYLGILSVILIIAVLLITLLVLVPLDNNIKTWTEATVPADFDSIRAKWKSYHAARTFLSVASFACFSAFLLMEDKSTR